MLTKYSNYNGKVSSVLRYCQITDISFKYFKNKVQGTEWLAKPLGEYRFSEITDVSQIKIENKKEKSFFPGFEIVLENERDNKSEPQKVYFTSDSEKESLNWVATLKRFTEKEGNID